MSDKQPETPKRWAILFVAPGEEERAEGAMKPYWRADIKGVPVSGHPDVPPGWWYSETRQAGEARDGKWWEPLQLDSAAPRPEPDAIAGLVKARFAEMLKKLKA